MPIHNEANKLTNEFYNDGESTIEYAGRTDGRKIEWLIEDLGRAVAGLDKSSKIFEFGSGTGEDAGYLRSLGYEVDVSDISQNFLDILSESGFKPRRLDALTDPFPEDCDLLLANFLLQHFPSQQLEPVIVKVFRSLKPGGRFSFTIAVGEGEGLLPSPSGKFFYWCRWSQDDLLRLLEKTGFRQAIMSDLHPGFNKSSWLSVFVEKPSFLNNDQGS